MKKLLLSIVLIGTILTGCGSPETTATAEVEKNSEMLPSGVMYYLSTMTSNYSSAYTVATSKEKKNEYLSKAITDINLAVQEIEDEYVDGTPPTADLFMLAEKLKSVIEADMLGDRETAYNYAVETGEIIGRLSQEYLDGELPIGVKHMIDK